MLIWLQCQATPLTTTATVKCDCEKQVTDNPANTGRPGNEASAAKQRPDEPFSGSLRTIIDWTAADPASPGNLAPDPSPIIGHAIPVFQPPRV
jgi:hypothetical protein